MPRITWFNVPVTGNVGAGPAAADAGAGLGATSAICLSAAPSVPSSALSGRKLIGLEDERRRDPQPAAARACPARRPASCCGSCRRDPPRGCLSRGPRNTSPVSGGPASPSSISPWQTAQRISKIASPRMACSSRVDAVLHGARLLRAQRHRRRQRERQNPDTKSRRELHFFAPSLFSSRWMIVPLGSSTFLVRSGGASLPASWARAFLSAVKRVLVVLVARVLEHRPLDAMHRHLHRPRPRPRRRIVNV